MAYQTDSSCDPQELHDISSESDSPLINASATTKKRCKERDIRKRTQQSRSDSHSRSRSPSHDSTNTSTSSSTSKPGRKITSIIWNHCTQKVIDGKIYTICNHCKNQSWILNSSMLTAKYHLTNIHYDKLSEEEKKQLTTKR